MSEPKLRIIIREYLKDAELKETLHDSKLDVGYRFIFPKGKNPQGRPIGKPFSVIMTKEKKYLEISTSLTLSGGPLKSWNALKIDIKRSFLDRIIQEVALEGLLHSFDIKTGRFLILDTIHFQEGKIISKNIFYTSIKKVHGCMVYLLIELRNFFSNDIKWDQTQMNT